MKSSLHKFRIDSKYITDVADEKYITAYVPSTGETIKGKSYGNMDHPEFTRLRDKLENDGYITTERHYWNGDRVTHPFTLNGMPFSNGESFPCACALAVKFSVWKKTK
jgi:hypothetical protein